MYYRKLNIDVPNFISEIEKHPCLWSLETSSQRRSAAAARAWVDISAKLNKPEVFLRVKWKNLKDCYRKELKRNYYDGEYKGIWKHFEALDFLRGSLGMVERNDEIGSDDDNNEAKVSDKKKADPFVVQLINEIEKYECLWNKDYKATSHQRAKATSKAWLELSEKLGKAVNDIRITWKSLRFTYKREVRKNFINGEYKGVWPYFDLMIFVKVEIACSTDITELIQGTNDSDEEMIDANQISGDNENLFKIEIESDTPFDNPNYEEDPFLETRLIIDDDKYDLMFLKSLVPFFRGMDSVRKLVLRSKIQEMLINELATN